ncbi:MAG: oligosaccharide flippase family protein [Gallionella sp.]|nr:oligosaccharide flippase family protein [Gallionella sp.]
MLRKNIFANYLGAGAVAVAPILALPWYLAALGPKQFGLVGFIVVLQAVLGLLDAGLGQALVREIAVRFGSADRGVGSTASLLFGFERLYWLFALCAGCITLLLADTIAIHWLNLEGMPAASGREAIYGAAFIFAAQFPGSIYRSLLVGAQAQVALNGIMLSGALVRHGGGVIVVLAWPTLTAYLIWHASIALLETLVRGKVAWQTLNLQRGQVCWEASELRPVLGLVAGMSGATLLGALTVQMDRIILSQMVSLEQFGYYTIAATVAVGALQLIHPLMQGILPRAIQVRANPVALRTISIKLLAIITLVVAVSATAYFAAGEWLLSIWLRDSEAVAVVYPILTIMLAGTALNAFYNVGYMNWIVGKNIRRLLQVNTAALILSVVLIPWFVIWQGTIGAAFGWLAINLIGFLLSLEWLKQKPVSEKEWCDNG